MAKTPWVYTRSRQNSMRKAQKRHVLYVRLGEEAYAKRHKR
jgi:hypothetical protein